MFGRPFSPGLNFYLDAIEGGEPFSFVRYGDGDLLIACPTLRYRHFPRGRVDFHRPLTKRIMAKTLTKCHVDSRYWPAVDLQHVLAFRRSPWQFRRLRRWIRGSVPRLRWHDAAVWRKAAEAGQIHLVIETVKNCPLPKVVIGPSNLKTLVGLLGAAHVETSRHYAWRQRKVIVNAIRELSPAFFSMSAGPAAKVIIHALWPQVGHESYLVDFGAVWDPYCGVKSRPYHRTMEIESLACMPS